MLCALLSSLIDCRRWDFNGSKVGSFAGVIGLTKKLTMRGSDGSCANFGWEPRFEMISDWKIFISRG